MSTAILSRPLEAPTYALHPLLYLKNHWKWLLKLLPARERSEKFNRLVRQYRTLPLEVRQSEAGGLIESVRTQIERRQPSWDDIDTVERALLTMLSGEDLRRYGWTLRAEFQRATGTVTGDQPLAKAYHDSKPPEVDKSEEAALKADLLSLQNQLQELCAGRRTQLRARNVIASWTVLLSGLAIFITLQLDKILSIPDTIIFDVFGVGMLGGLFSTLLRIQKFKLCAIGQGSALGEAGNQISAILSPAIGGAGAVVLFVMLVAGFLKGSFFPDLLGVNFGPDADFLEDLFKVKLAASTEAAKLYLLCFMAGFSERLVPNALSRLSSLANKGKSG